MQLIDALACYCLYREKTKKSEVGVKHYNPEKFTQVKFDYSKKRIDKLLQNKADGSKTISEKHNC